jgi:hypothetical protein
MNETITVTTIIAVLVGIIATGRMTRLIVDDDWPPIVWLREKYVMAVPAAWAELAMCGFCVAPWVALPNLLIGWASDLAFWWWLPNLWFAGAYAAAMLNARDVPSE